MNDHTHLERHYRRLLAWYPKTFREQHEDEMLCVLLAGARDGQRRPGLADSADLIGTALRMRLAPRAPRSVPTVFWAVRLMFLACALELVALATVALTESNVRASLAGNVAPVAAVHGAAILHTRVVSIEIGAPIAAAVWLALAWGNGRGYGWARVALLVVFGLTSVSLFASIAQQAATYAPADLIAGAALWLVALVSTVLVASPTSSHHYQRLSAA